MASKPLVIIAGQVEQLPSGTSIDVGGWTLPSAAGTTTQLLQADIGGDAQWINTPNTWDWSNPTVDDQVFVSNGANTASWVTAGNNQLLGSNAAGAVAWEDKPFFYKSSPPAASGDDQIFRSDGVGSATWLTAGNDQVLGSNVTGVIAWEDQSWSRVLTANESVYVDPTGNDTTGDGGIGAPYATVPRALTHIGALYAGTYTVTVNIAAGHYSSAARMNFNYPFGANVYFYGAYEDHAACALSNIDAATSAYVAGLVYFDFDVTLPVGKTAVVDDYIMFRTAAGGVNPELSKGVHKVIAWNAGTRVATVRAYQRTGSAALPSGAVTCDISVMKTVLQFPTANCTGLRASGTFHAGVWYDMVFEGSETATSYGINLQFGACCQCGGRFGISGWGIGIFAIDGSVVSAAANVISKSYLHAVKVTRGGIVGVGTSIISGSRTNALLAQDGSTIAAKYATVHSSRGVSSEDGSYCNIGAGDIINGDATVALYADVGGGIDATGSTVSGGWSAVRSPMVNTGNNQGWIVGPTAAYVDEVYGAMYADNVSETVTVGFVDTAYEVTAGFTTGSALSGCTFGGAHYVEADFAGTYKISWALSLDTAVAADELEGGIMINGARQAEGTAHCYVPANSVSESFGGNAILALSAADEVSVFVMNHTAARDIVVEHGNLSIVRIGD